MEDKEAVNKENSENPVPEPASSDQPQTLTRRGFLGKFGRAGAALGLSAGLGIFSKAADDKASDPDRISAMQQSANPRPMINSEPGVQIKPYPEVVEPKREEPNSDQAEEEVQKTEEIPEDKEGELYMSLLDRYIDTSQYPNFWEGVFGAIETRDSEENDHHIELKSVMNAVRTVDTKILDYRISKDKKFPSLGMTIVERNYLKDKSTISLSIDLNDLNKVQYGQDNELSPEQKKEMIDKILTRDNMKDGEWNLRDQQGVQFYERQGENLNGVKFRQIFSNVNNSFNLIVEYPYEPSIKFHFFERYGYKPVGGPTI